MEERLQGCWSKGWDGWLSSGATQQDLSASGSQFASSASVMLHIQLL
jgi:hypothetical protein